MHVALISHDIYPGDGQGRVNYELARSLLAADVTVDLFADRIDESLLDLGARWIPVHPRGQSVNLLRVWHFRRLVNQLLDERADDYDVILACGVVLSRPHTINVAHFVHGTWINSPFHPARRHRGLRRWYYRLYSWLNARWEREVFAQADTVVAVSERVRDDLVHLGVPPNRLQTIPNGVDPSEFHPGPSNRRTFDLPDGPVLGLFVGDLQSPIKNLDTALRALAQVPQLHLAVAGTVDGSPYPEMAEDLGVADRTHFLDFQRDVASLMRCADFFVLPSHQDAFGLVVTEAMASGLPVVVSRAVGASYLVSEEAGIVIDSPDDTEAFATAFRHLASDSALRHRMGRAARSIALDCSWAAMGRRYLRLFRQHHERAAPQPSGSPPAYEMHS